MARVAVGGPEGVGIFAPKFEIFGVMYDIRKYGAAVDGVTDDADAIDLAIAAARDTGKAAIVMIPWGQAFISRTINLVDGVTLMGASKWYSGLLASADITMVSTNALSYCGLQNLKLEGPAQGTATGFQISANSHQARVRDVYFTKLNYGVTVAWDSAILDNFSSYQCAYPIYANHTAHNLTILHPNIDACVRGMWLGATAESRNIRAYGGMVQNASDIGIQVAGYAADVILDGIYFEGNTTCDIGTDNNPANLVIRATCTSSQPANHIYIDSSGGTLLLSPRFKANPTSHCISLDSNARDVKIYEPIFTGITGGKEMSFHASSTWFRLRDRTMDASKGMRFAGAFVTDPGADPDSGVGLRLVGGTTPRVYAYDYSTSAWKDVTIYTKDIWFSPQTGNFGITLAAVPAYANNAAALVGGLTAGQFYRTNGDPDTLCIVH